MSAAGANPGDQASQRSVTYEPRQQQSDSYANNQTDQRHDGRNEERQHSESRDRSRSRDNKSGVSREHRHANDQGHQPHSSGQGRQQHRQGQQSRDSNFGQWQQTQSQQGFNNTGGNYSYRKQDPYSRYPNGEWSADDYTFLSRTLSSILRHNAERFGFKLMKGGFLYVHDILHKVQKLHGFTLQDVQKVVTENDKKRFALEEEEGGQWKIRANQGHSLEVECLDLKPILTADEYPTVIHGTYYGAWEMIRKTGLRKMKRNHIHFARGEPGSSGVISGMRSSCEVIIHINMEKALADGLKFFVSANDVILSEGDKDGVIYPCYFQGAIDRKRTYKLDFDDKIGSAHGNSSESDTKKRKKKGKKGKLQNEASDDLKVDGCVNEEEASDQFAKKHRECATKNEDVAVTKETVDVSRQDANDNNASQSTVDVPNTTEQTADDTGTCNQTTDDIDAIEQAVDDSKPVDTDSGGPEINENWEDCLSDANEDKKVEWKCPEFMNAAKSKEAIERLITDLPSFVVVCCVGENLGKNESCTRAIVVLVHPDIYVYHLCDDNKDLVKEGKLDTLLLEKKITKVFFNIGSVSRALIQEFDVLLNGIPIWDIELMYKSVTLANMDLEYLKIQYGFVGSFKKWHSDNETFGPELADPDINKDCLEKVTTQGQCITELFQFCCLKMNDDCRRKLRAETYKAALPGENEELADKVKELKPQKSGKKQKQTNTDAEPPQQQSQENKQQQGVKKPGRKQQQGGGKGRKGNKH